MKKNIFIPLAFVMLTGLGPAVANNSFDIPLLTPVRAVDETLVEPSETPTLEKCVHLNVLLASLPQTLEKGRGRLSKLERDLAPFQEKLEKLTEAKEEIHQKEQKLKENRKNFQTVDNEKFYAKIDLDGARVDAALRRLDIQDKDREITKTQARLEEARRTRKETTLRRISRSPELSPAIAKTTLLEETMRKLDEIKASEQPDYSILTFDLRSLPGYSEIRKLDSKFIGNFSRDISLIYNKAQMTGADIYLALKEALLNEQTKYKKEADEFLKNQNPSQEIATLEETLKQIEQEKKGFNQELNVHEENFRKIEARITQINEEIARLDNEKTNIDQSISKIYDDLAIILEYEPGQLKKEDIDIEIKEISTSVNAIRELIKNEKTYGEKLTQKIAEYQALKEKCDRKNTLLTEASANETFKGCNQTEDSFDRITKMWNVVKKAVGTVTAGPAFSDHLGGRDMKDIAEQVTRQRATETAPKPRRPIWPRPGRRAGEHAVEGPYAEPEKQGPSSDGLDLPNLPF